VKPFEREAVQLLVAGHIAAEVLQRVYDAPHSAYEHTGVGYFLRVRDEGLPDKRIVLSNPIVLGHAGDVEVGFVVFVEGHELTLECHGWGGAVPADVRDLQVRVEVASGARQ
jgi:hypothetical protein